MRPPGGAGDFRVCRSGGCARPHDHDPVGERQRLLLIVRDIDDRARKLPPQLQQLLTQRQACRGVERGYRLVEEDDLRLERERPRQRHALALSAGETGRERTVQAVQPETAQETVRALVRLRAQLRVKAQGVANILAHGHILKEGIVLKHQSHAAPLGRQARDVRAVFQNAPGVGRFQPREDSQERRLAAAGGPQHGEKFAARHVKADVVEHGRAGEPLVAVPHGELRRVRAAGQCVHLASSSAFTLGVLLDMSA